MYPILKREKFHQSFSTYQSNFLFYPRLKNGGKLASLPATVQATSHFPNILERSPPLHSRQDKWLVINSFAEKRRRQNEAISWLRGCVCVGKAAIDIHIRDPGVASVINGCIVHSKLSPRRRRRCTVAENDFSCRCTGERKKLSKVNLNNELLFRLFNISETHVKLSGVCI